LVSPLASLLPVFSLRVSFRGLLTARPGGGRAFFFRLFLRGFLEFVDERFFSFFTIGALAISR